MTHGHDRLLSAKNNFSITDLFFRLWKSVILEIGYAKKNRLWRFLNRFIEIGYDFGYGIPLVQLTY